jgi:hypothetical protein
VCSSDLVKAVVKSLKEILPGNQLGACLVAEFFDKSFSC